MEADRHERFKKFLETLFALVEEKTTTSPDTHYLTTVRWQAISEQLIDPQTPEQSALVDTGLWAAFDKGSADAIRNELSTIVWLGFLGKLPLGSEINVDVQPGRSARAAMSALADAWVAEIEIGPILAVTAVR